MQGEAIVNRILADANEKATAFITDADVKADAIIDKAEEDARLKQEKTEAICQEKDAQIVERFKTLSRIEGNKIILKKKQQILKDLQIKALDVLLSFDKKEMLALVEKLLKENAEENETLLFNIKNVTKDDIESLKITKSLKLKVEKSKSENQGIVLSSNKCDKNLLFKDLIFYAFDNNQAEINNILFQN